MIGEDVMKKISICLMVLLFTINVFAQNPKEIVENCVNALGGEEAIKKFTNYKAKGEIKISMQGMELPGKLESIQLVRKIYGRAEMKFGKDIYTIIMAYDGETAWMDRFGTIVDQPSLNHESDLDHDIPLLIEKEAIFSLTMEKEIEGKKTYGIEVDFKGKKTTFYIDQENFTIVEMVYKDLYFGEKYTKEMLERRVKFSDYKNFEGVLYPTGMIQYQEGKKLLEFKFDEITFNPEVALAIFKRPDQKLDLRYSEELIH
jgi:hypothetical protein